MLYNLTFAGNEKRSRNIASGSIFDVKSGFGVHFFRKLNESCAFCRTNELFTFSYELESTKLDLFNGINNTDVYFIFVQKLSYKMTLGKLGRVEGGIK